MKLTSFRCIECGEINDYLGDDIRQGCECNPIYLIPIKKDKRNV